MFTPHPLTITPLTTHLTQPFPLPSHPTTTPLSVIDAKVAQFGPAAAVWFFSAPSSPPTTTNTTPPPFSPALLLLSFRKTLSAYPQWAGRVSAVPHPSSAPPPTSTHPFPPHTRRPRRLFVTYGTGADPGVMFSTAACAQTLADMVPSPEARARMPQGWDAAELDVEQFLPAIKVWFSAGFESGEEGHLGMGACVTRFACGGVAVGVKMAHCLADAAAMTGFVRGWAGVHGDLLGRCEGRSELWTRIGAGRDEPEVADTTRGEEVLRLLNDVRPAPVFDPLLLNATAAGDVDAPAADPTIVARARHLPQHRYDWWASGGDCPEVMQAACAVPAGFDAARIGDPIPWAEWDFGVAVAHRVLHFSAAELENIWRAASIEMKGEPGDPSTATSRISRHDALLAFVWMLVNRARGFARDAAPVHLNMTLGLRARLALPEHFVGSPLVLARVSSPGEEACDAERLAVTAQRMRDTLGTFDRHALGAVLHDAMFQDSPQRVWNGFLGVRDVIVTSWARLGTYGISFDPRSGRGPWLVQPVMPAVDGIIEIMEAPFVVGGEQEVRVEGEGERSWYAGGVDVDLNFDKVVVEKLVEDEMLRKFSVR
ncbi:hypothetical protein MMC34_005620 [Xylographa carneopallida]|nr:hypothetical protein [Xylographa carneopallida]